MISISCLESKLLNNNNWYGRFQLAPFQKGEGLTIANALRRTLLAEKSNFFITWVDFYNAEIPYSVLTGMRESIFDILLNLKQVIFTSDKILPNNSYFFKMPSSNNFSTQKRNSFSKPLQINFLKEHSIRVLNRNIDASGFFSNQKDGGLNITLNNITNRVNPKHQRIAQGQILHFNKPHRGGYDRFRDLNNLNHGYLKTQNVFCQNQVLGKMINSEDETPYLLPLRIFSKDIDLSGQFTNTAKKINNLTYTGYICAKGPATIYAKNIKLPKGLKCVDPDKYIVTLADDGLFYLRFALTTEIQAIPSNNISNTTIKINQGIKYNRVKLKTLPKIVFNQEIESNFHYKIYPSIQTQKKSKKSNQLSLYNNFFNNSITERKIIEFNYSKMVNYSKNLIDEQRLLLTNDSIKQLNFQNTSITANIQKTCLLNLQIKHYYYKCGRFDRFLFDLIKSFKPSLKSTYYNKTSFCLPFNSLNGELLKHRKNSFYQRNDASILVYFQRILKRQALPLVSLQVPHPQRNKQWGETQKYKLMTFNQNNVNFKIPKWRFFKKPLLDNLIKKQHLIDKIICKSSNVNSFFSVGLHSNKHSLFIHHNQKSDRVFNISVPRQDQKHELAILKNKYLDSSFIRWQKTFKFIKRPRLETSSIYNYLQKLHTSETIIISFLFRKLSLESEISLLNSKPVFNIDPKRQFLAITLISLLKTDFNKNAFFEENANKQIPQFYLEGENPLFGVEDFKMNKEFKNSNFGVSKLNQPARRMEKFLNTCLLFQCVKNNILYILKSYAAAQPFLKYNNLSNLNRNPMHKKTILSYLLVKSGFTYTEKPLTKINFLRQWSFLLKKHSKKIKGPAWKLINQLYISSGSTLNQAMDWDSNKDGSLNSVRRSTNLRTKPFISVGQISYKPIWIFSCQFQQKNKLWSSLYNINLNDFKHAQTNKKLFLNFSYLEKKVDECFSPVFDTSKTDINHNREMPLAKRQVFSSRKTMFNPITTDSVVLKPVYLNVEQIIYILKQTTRFCKNQRINPVFFDSLNRINKNNDYPLNHSLIFPKVSNSLSVFLQNFPHHLTQRQIMRYCSINDKTWIYKNTYKPSLYHIWILGNDFIFKRSHFNKYSHLNKVRGRVFESQKYDRFKERLTNFSYTNLKNQGYLPGESPYHFNTAFLLPQSSLMSSFPMFTVDSKLNIQNSYNEPYNINVYHSKIAFNLRYTYPFKYTIFETVLPFVNFSEKIWYSPKNNNLASVWPVGGKIQTRPPKKTEAEAGLIFFKNFDKTKAHYVGPEHSKTLWPGFLPNISGRKCWVDKKQDYKFNNLLQNNDSFFLASSFYPGGGKMKTRLSFQHVEKGDVKNENSAWREKRNKNYQVTNTYNKNIGVLNSRIISFGNFDYIKYNESFKIYTTLAYTCLKTYDADLAKYHNFNRRNQKKSQVVSFQPIDSLIQNWVPVEKNRNWIVNNEYEKFYHEKHNVFPSLIIHNQLPTILNSAYKWGIMNNSNFNDAFIIIPCTWSLNFQLNRSSNLTNLFELYAIASDILFPPPNEVLEQRGPEINRQVELTKQPNLFSIKNKLRLAGLKTTNINNELKWLRSYPERDLTTVQFSVNNKTKTTNWREGMGNSTKLSFFIPKFKIKRSLKKLAISFENIYYKNFLWNSRKITLRVLNNAVLPLVPNRKYSISDFIPKKNYQALAFTNMNIDIPITTFYNPKFSTSFLGLKHPYLNFSNTNVWNHKHLDNRVSRRGLSKNKNDILNKMTNNWFYQLSTFNQFSGGAASLFLKETTMGKIVDLKSTILAFYKIYNYQKPPCYSIRHKSLGTTNFMCSKNYPRFLNDNQIEIPNFAVHVPETSLFSGGAFLNSDTFSFSDNKLKMLGSKVSETQAVSNFLQKNEDLPYLSSASSRIGGTSKNQLQTQRSDNFLVKPFSSLRSKWKPFFTGSLKYSQAKIRDYPSRILPIVFDPIKHDAASPVDFLQVPDPQSSKRWENSYTPKKFFSESPFVDFITQNEKLNQNSKHEFLSYNQVINSQLLIEDPFRPERLVSLRKNRWIHESSQGSISCNIEDIYKNNSTIKSPLINNLWLSSFFSKYSLYAISTKSDLFLQNLMSNDNWIPPTNDIEIFQRPRRETNSGKNLKEPLSTTREIALKKNQYHQTSSNQFLNIKSSARLFDKTIQNVLKSQENTSAKYFIPNYNYNWQKAVHFAILGRFKKAKFNIQLPPVVSPQAKRWDEKKVRSSWYKNQPKFFLQYPKKNLNYAGQPRNRQMKQSENPKNPISELKNNYWIRRLKIYERYFGNPLRRRISQNRLIFYNITLQTKFYKEFSTQALPGNFFHSKPWDNTQQFKKTNQQIIKSWKSIIWTTQADIYFCFRYPLFIQNCNLPWQKSKHIFYISKHWFTRITGYLQSLLKLTSLWKTININTALNTNLFMTYTQLSSSSNKTHQFLLPSRLLTNIKSQVYMHLQNNGSYGMVGYFTIKESLNSIYKVNYIVESQPLESKPISELAFHSNQNNRVTMPPNLMEDSHTMKKLENIERNSVTTDSLTVSNFLNGAYSFIPSKTIILSSFNELIDSQINKSKIENENEYIQIDIWTNGEISPRQALLNAFRKLFELFYNLSKYNCLKPIEI